MRRRPWPTVASVLTVARFCGQRTELGIAERWDAHRAIEDLVGVSGAKINEDRLYRGLDVLAAHKDRLCAHLLERYRSWFGVAFEFLLDDVTSTFFEGQAAANKKAARGERVEARILVCFLALALWRTPRGGCTAKVWAPAHGAASGRTEHDPDGELATHAGDPQ